MVKNIRRLKTVKSVQVNEDLRDQFIGFSLARNSKVAYGKGWRCFQDYCSENGIESALSATEVDVANFFVKLATVPSKASGRLLSMGTLMLYRSGINRKYVEAGKISPTAHPKVKSILRGLSRVRGVKPRQVKAMREYDVEGMLKSCDEAKLIGLRDAAIIALGFAGALRRSEICDLRVEDVEISSFERGKCRGAKRMFVHIRKSKTDQESKGQKIAIIDGKRIKPISRLQAWLSGAKITQGHLFQTMRRGGKLRGSPMHHSDIPRILKHYAKRIGLDPKDIAGHSLRAGFVTSAAAHHARLDKIMEVTRHTNTSTVMKYIRDANSFQDHAGKNFL